MNIATVISVIFALTVLPKATLGVANGTVDDPHSRPWAVVVSAVLSQNSYQTCTGILISPNYVLTVASCFHYDNKYVKIHSVITNLGINDFNAIESFVQVSGNIPITKVSQHENFNITTLENDIAIIELDIPAQIIEGLVEVAVLATEDDIQEGQVGRIGGWFYPLRETINTRPSHSGDVTVVANSVCQEVYPSYIFNENVICTSGYVAFCQAEQGAGLVIDGKVAALAFGPLPVLVITEQCPIVPNTYLNIPKYLDWIKAHSDLE